MIVTVSRQEQALLSALHEEPGDDTAWLVLADFLEEQGDPRHELLRLRHFLADPHLRPTKREPAERRLVELIVSGVKPCLPTRTNSIGMTFSLITPGSFWMGSPDNEEGRYGDEGPRHLVRLTRPYYLGQHLVTQEQYQRVMRENPSHYQPNGPGAQRLNGVDHTTLPVDRVSWVDADRFCRKLSRLTAEKKAGRTYRLPTEAEWEYACRAGTTTPFFFGKKLTSQLANFDGTRRYGARKKGVHLDRTSPGGSFPPNAWGLYDMHGNLWEWCADWFHRRYYEQSPETDPTGPADGEMAGDDLVQERVLRGGSFYYIGSSCRAAIRLDRAPDVRSNLDGFRVVLEWRPAGAE